MTETTIPILPCKSIDETLAFYGALGFEVTYQQKRPNTYAVVERGGIGLHFFVLRGLDPASSYSTCYVSVADVDGLYGAFSRGLRQAFGRLPSRGVPRIGALKDTSYGVRQFIVVDPGGNYIRIGQPLETADGWAHSRPPSGSRLQKAVHAAALLGDSKGDHAAAAKVLDGALAAADPASDVDRVKALILRADFAVRMGERQMADRLLGDVRSMELDDVDLKTIGDDLQRARDLKQELQSQVFGDPDDGVTAGNAR